MKLTKVIKRQIYLKAAKSEFSQFESGSFVIISHFPDWTQKGILKMRKLLPELDLVDAPQFIKRGDTEWNNRLHQTRITAYCLAASMCETITQKLFKNNLRKIYK